MFFTEGKSVYLGWSMYTCKSRANFASLVILEVIIGFYLPQILVLGGRLCSISHVKDRITRLVIYV